MQRVARVVGALLLVPVLLVLVLAGNWLRQGSRQVSVEPLEVEVDADAVAAILGEAVRIPTISVAAGVVDADALAGLHQLLEARFPRVHATLTRRVVAGHSLLYTWPGRDPSLEPVLLLAHMDVVPVEDEAGWAIPPFSGAIRDGTVHGRGTLDDKVNVVAQLAAVEQLLAEGFAPDRTVYLAFGHDEEVAGSGAAAMAALLEREGVRAHLVLDEGGSVVDDVLDGLEVPGAFVGIAEKGYVSVEVTARATGGHSSMPPATTAAGRVAAAAVALEDTPMPASFSGPTGLMLDHLGPEMTLPMGMVLTNRWLLGGVVKQVMSADPKPNASLRTTTAVTMLRGSVKDNVLPQNASLVVNFRIAPGDTTDTVLEHVRDVVGDGFDVEVYGAGIGSEPSPVSEVGGAPWHALATAIRQTWPEAVVAPFLALGATDARHYTGLSRAVYRFSPMRVTGDDLDGIHGQNERISVENVGRATAFYVRLLKGVTVGGRR